MKQKNKTTRKIRSPFPWFGGKGNLKIKNKLLELMPPHSRYIEPFGGGASILLAKDQSEVEVYNDVNRGVVSFFRIIADAEQFPKFMTRVSMLPVSREFYEECLRTWVGIHDPVEQAVRWYVVARQSFGGIFGNSWGTTINSTTRGISQSTASWQASFENLHVVHNRMQQTQIECCDWRDALKRFSGDGWLAYCDPPYVSGTRKAGGYKHELQNEDHEEFIETLLNYDGAIMLSGYDNEIYRPLKQSGWDLQMIDVVCSAAGCTRQSGLQGTGAVKKKQQRTECIWRNHEAMKRIASTQ